MHRVRLEEVIRAELVDDGWVEFAPILVEISGYDSFVLLLNRHGGNVKDCCYSRKSDNEVISL